MALPTKDILAAMDQANVSPSRSELSRWMRRNHDALAARLGPDKPDWIALARVFKEAGLTDRTGKPASPETARKAWERTRRSVALSRAKRGQAELDPARTVASPAPAPVSAAAAPDEPADDHDDRPRMKLKPIQPKGRP